jgi:LemA protein
MKPLWIVLGVVALIIVVLLFIGGSYIGAKNTLVQKNEAVNQAFSPVNVVQQRRLDLIPNLVASVKGYVAEESTILTNIANARAGVLAAGSDHASNINANSKLDVALGPFFRLQEQYPDLKGNQQFMRLTDELAGTENRIATERQRYNKTLQDYNTFVQQFPNSIWANMAGFHYRDEYFKGNPENSVAPKVDFSK